MRCASKGGWAAALCIAAAPVPAANPLDFDTAFATGGEPAFLHAVVLYAGGGVVHRLELWRDHERRLLRQTDQRLTTLATRGAGAGYDLLMLDHVRRTSTRVSRDNLYRVGQFSDWEDLGHGLRHPRGAYRLAVAKQPIPATLPATLGPCRWFSLEQGGNVSHICWSMAERFPLLIANNRWQSVWRAVSLTHTTIPSSRFKIDDRGYVRNDADRDIAGD